MSKFRKKPVVIEATQFLLGKDADPDRNLPPFVEFVGYDAFSARPQHVVRTSHGAASIKSGDWVITGVNGEHYPCENDVFVATYDVVELDPGEMQLRSE